MPLTNATECFKKTFEINRDTLVKSLENVVYFDTLNLFIKTACEKGEYSLLVNISSIADERQFSSERCVEFIHLLEMFGFKAEMATFQGYGANKKIWISWNKK